MIILKSNSKNFVKETAREIKNGKVIVFPTDTVYGLLADATDRKAVERVFKIKKRDKGKPLPIFVKDIKMAKKLAVIDKRQEKILKSVWPGKTTVVLKRTRLRTVFTSASARQGKTIALRIPKDRIIHYLLSVIGQPLTGTSANISGKPESTEIAKIIKQLKNKKYQPDLIIDAGNLKKSKPSTIIDLSSCEIKILREGEIKIK